MPLPSYSQTTHRLFSPVLVTDLVNKVKGESVLAKLCGSKPIPFTGAKVFTFNLDKDVLIEGEMQGTATKEGGISVESVTIRPARFEYGARISEDFLTASEEEQIEILETFNDGFAKKLARGFDIAAFHGLNPRNMAYLQDFSSNSFANSLGKNAGVSTYVDSTADADIEKYIETALTAVESSNGTNTGMVLSPKAAKNLSHVKENGVTAYPEFKFGNCPENFYGLDTAVSKEVYYGNGGESKYKIHGILGDFRNGFKWGFSKDIEFEVIPYGDPDNSGKDLKGNHQIYLKAEAYIGWGVIVPEWFAGFREA